ncbi:MAG: adenylosuccinate synthase [Candidatus Eisenbacteria bacterium]
MPSQVVVGMQWGDEGKGKIVDALSDRADFIVRYQGGANAGHTVVVGNKTFILHLVPSGILRPDKVCILGNGVVIDPEALFREISQLETDGVQVEGRLHVSLSAHVILPYHRLTERLFEEFLGDRRIGTAGRGIGPAYRDKVSRVGVRVCDLLDPRVLRDKILVLSEQTAAFASQVAEREGLSSVTLSAPQHGPASRERETDYFFEEPSDVLNRYLEFGERLRPMAADVSGIINRALDDGRHVLFEGAQGALLDVDHGSYPYVSSSSATAGGACTGTGVGPTRIDEVVGVAKAYTTRVGNGPLPTELSEDASAALRDAGAEYGATTGRPRRCGWFDAVVARYAARVNGVSKMYLTKLDVLDESPELKICTGYDYQGLPLEGFPASLEAMFRVEPVYETLPGWNCALKDVRRKAELPEKALRYVERIRELVGVKVAGISVGSRRDEMVFFA